MALLWAAGFIWMAVNVASASKKEDAQGQSNGTAAMEDVTGIPIASDDVNMVEQGFNDF